VRCMLSRRPTISNAASSIPAPGTSLTSNTFGRGKFLAEHNVGAAEARTAGPTTQPLIERSSKRSQYPSKHCCPT